MLPCVLPDQQNVAKEYIYEISLNWVVVLSSELFIVAESLNYELKSCVTSVLPLFYPWVSVIIQACYCRNPSLAANTLRIESAKHPEDAAFLSCASALVM